MSAFVLEILDGDRAGETVSLGGTTLGIGRKPSNGLQLNDEKVSGVHAEIAFEDGRYVLRDQKSTNGTLLDGRRIDEVALTAFDTFQIGRIRLVFREEGAQSPVDALKLHRVDTQRASKRRGGLGLVLGVAVVAVAAGGAWFYLQGSGAGAGGGRRSAAREPMAIAGNLLPAAAASCEDGEGWDLRAEGGSFDLADLAHSGRGSLAAARRAAEAGDGDAAETTFALARASEPLTVRAGRGLRLSGFVRGSGGGQALLRLRFTSSVDDFAPLYASTPPAVLADSFAEVACAAQVPAGMDLVDVELVALLPAVGAEVGFDDVGLVDVADAPGFDLTVAACNLVGTPSSATLRHGPDTVVEAVRPVRVLDAALAAVGSALVTDHGASLRAEATAEGFVLRVDPAAGGLVLELPANVAAGLRWASGDGVFELPAVAAMAAKGPREVLFGSGAARVLASADAAAVRGEASPEGLLLAFEGAVELRLRVVFDAERVAAGEALRTARALADEQPGEALEQLAALIARHPHDDAALAQAERLRADLLLALGQRVRELQAEFDQAVFFAARGALTRVEVALDELLQRYGKAHVPPEVAGLRTAVEQRQAEFAAAEAQAERQRLEALQEVLQLAAEPQLRQLVQDYLRRMGQD